MTDTERAIQHLDRMLADQRKALLAGDIVGLGHMVPKLEKGLRDLARHDPDPSRLEHLRQTAARNAQLVSAASEGLNQARSLLQTRAASQFSTYDQAGQKSAMAVASEKTLSRR